MRTLLAGRRSAHKMMKPPMMNVVATTAGVNKFALMALPNSKPRMTAGTKAMNTFSAKRWASALRGKARTVLLIFCQYTMITAKIAPV
jgi:hypothetical protein